VARKYGPRRGALGEILQRIVGGILAGDGTRLTPRDQLRGADEALREAMKQLRRQRRRRSTGLGGNAVVRASKNRHIKDHSRRRLKAFRAALRRDPRMRIDADLLDTKYRSCEVLDTLVPNRRELWKGILQRPNDRVEIVDLKKFSFLDDPAAALAGLKRLGQAEARAKQARLNFKDDHCEDAGAFLVLAEIWPRMARIFKGGEMAPAVQRVLTATGVSEHNNMLTLATIRARAKGEEAHPDVWAYPLQRRRPANTSKSPTQHLDSQAREKAADRLSSWLDDCLGESANLELTDKGRAQLAMIMGEALCNAERHSQPQSDDGGWSITAFMERLEDERGLSSYRCMVAFLSIGQSISESLRTAADDVRTKLYQFQSMHARCGRSPETLATVFALQDTITCDPAAREARSGGTGLQDILDFVSVIGAARLASNGPRVTIVSGRSCIRLKDPYIRGRRAEADGYSPRLLWLNESNTMDCPPDDQYAFDLPDRLAGTLVSIAFTIDQEFLVQQLESERDDRDRS